MPPKLANPGILFPASTHCCRDLSTFIATRKPWGTWGKLHLPKEPSQQRVFNYFGELIHNDRQVVSLLPSCCFLYVRCVSRIEEILKVFLITLDYSLISGQQDSITTAYSVSRNLLPFPEFSWVPCQFPRKALRMTVLWFDITCPTPKFWFQNCALL